MKHYLVTIISGDEHDPKYTNVFTTPDKGKAEAWKKKFNRVVKIGKEWIDNYDLSQRFEEPFFYWERKYEKLICTVEEIEFRE
jgi:hypothetical protein